jgi:hypothetical protein
MRTASTRKARNKQKSINDIQVTGEATLDTPASPTTTRRLSFLAVLDVNNDGKVSWTEYLDARKKGIVGHAGDGEDELGSFEARMRKIRDIIIYLLFMVCFTMSSIRDLQNSDMYYFGRNLQDQFTGLEMDASHSPVWAKTFTDVTTVEEFFHFLYGPVTSTAFSANTFNADSSYAFEGGTRKATTLGYGKMLGAVRVSQLRSKAFDCQFHVHKAMSSNFNFTCFGSQSWFGFGDYSTETELDEDFGAFTLPHFDEPSMFRYNGIQGYTGKNLTITAGEQMGELADTVAGQRGKYMSTFKTKKYRSYPSPAYSVLLPPSLLRGEAQEIMSALASSNYVDLHTRAIFVDANVYNPMLDRICHCRMVGEITAAGGVMPTFDFQVVRLWERVSAVDELYVMFTTFVGFFYGYYMWELYKEFKKEGSKTLTSFLHVVQITNVVFFFASVGCQVYAESMYPASMDPNSEEYFDVGPSIRFKGWAICIQAINVFLNWFKLINILGYSSTFALVNGTIERSASRVGGFLLVFFVIFYGFSQTHCMIFQNRLEEFRTIGDSCFTLMRSLLGDFDFLKLQDANLYMGPLLFIIFVILAVFVVLNMLIAIISDAYMEVQAELAEKPDVDLLEDIKDYIVIQLLTGNYKRTLKVIKFLMPTSVDQWTGPTGTPSSASIVPASISPVASPVASPTANHSHKAELVEVHKHSPSTTAIMNHIKSLEEELFLMRQEQSEARQVTALLIREVQGTLRFVKTAAAAPSFPPTNGGGTAPSLPIQLPLATTTREV